MGYLESLKRKGCERKGCERKKIGGSNEVGDVIATEQDCGHLECPFRAYGSIPWV